MFKKSESKTQNSTSLGLVINFSDQRFGTHGISRVILAGANLPAP